MVEQITGDTLLDAAVSGVADKLTLGWNIISGNAPLPDRPKIEALSREFLLTKKITHDGKNRLDLNGLSEEKRKTLTQYGMDVDGVEAFADEQSRNKLAAAVDRGVKSADNWWNKIINAIAGFIDWMSSGFKNGFAGLWEKIGERGAASVKKSVRDSVAAAMKDDEKLQRFSPYMGMMDHAVHDKVMETVTGKTPAQRGIPAPEPIVPLPGHASAIKTEVTKRVHEQLDGLINQNPDLDKNLGSLLGSDEHGKTRTEEMKGTLTSAALKLATDKNYAIGKKAADMSDEEFKTAVRGKLAEEFKNLNVTDDGGKPVALTKWYEDNWTGNAFTSPIRWTKRKVGGLPGDSQELPEYLADESLKKISPEALSQLKQVRALAENDYNVDLAGLLKLSDGTYLADAKEAGKDALKVGATGISEAELQAQAGPKQGGSLSP